MNTTRSIWSKTLKCCNLRQTPEILFLCSAGIISFLPIFFYLVVRYYGPIKDLPYVLKRKYTHILSNTQRQLSPDSQDWQ